MGLTLLYSLLRAVKSKNSGLKTWFGILAAWNPKSLMKNGGISFESYTRFQLGVGSLARGNT